jgi:DNA-binding NtrC family response regulator
MEIQQWICPVLIVDDDIDLCGLLEATVRKICPVHSEHDLNSAGHYLAKLKPEIVFLDNSLPDGKGLLFIKEILTLYPDVKIILMTADLSAGLKEMAIAAGAVRFIAKPFQTAIIKNLIFSICPELRAA